MGYPGNLYCVVDAPYIVKDNSDVAKTIEYTELRIVPDWVKCCVRVCIRRRVSLGQTLKYSVDSTSVTVLNGVKSSSSCSIFLFLGVNI